MAIIFKTGKRISDVVVSTALGQSGRGMFPYTWQSEYRRFLELVREKNITVFSKSSTRYPRIGNFQLQYPWTWKYIKKIGDRSMLNAYGLTNYGVEVNAREIAISRDNGFRVVPNYYPEFEKGIKIALRELIESVEIYLEHLGFGFSVLELNASCPNSDEIINKNMDMVIQCVEALKAKYPWLMIIVKTSIVHSYNFYKRLELAGADAIHSVNTIPYNLVFPGKESPLHKKGGGGVSGEEAFDLAYRYNEKLKNVTSLPIIMACGVTDTTSKVLYSRAGADSVGICTIVLLDSKKACELF